MSTFDVHLSTEPWLLTVEADGVRPSRLNQQGVTTSLAAYELVDTDGAVVLAVPLDALAAIRRHKDGA